MKIDFSGYVIRQWKKKYKDGVGRNWFLVKRNGNQGFIRIGMISLPKKYIGKRIRLKLEVING